MSTDASGGLVFRWHRRGSAWRAFPLSSCSAGALCPAPRYNRGEPAGSCRREPGQTAAYSGGAGHKAPALRFRGRGCGGSYSYCGPSRVNALCDTSVIHRDGARFCPKPHLLHACQTDSGVKRPCASAFACTTAAISWSRASPRSQGNCVSTSSTCRMSYQTDGALSLRKSVPLLLERHIVDYVKSGATVVAPDFAGCELRASVYYLSAISLTRMRPSSRGFQSRRAVAP